MKYTNYYRLIDNGVILLVFTPSTQPKKRHSLGNVYSSIALAAPSGHAPVCPFLGVVLSVGTHPRKNPYSHATLHLKT
jgi:hypothetical protein